MALRVITGLRKGHKLQGPDSREARPTEDRIKESLFNILNPIKEDAIVLDLFACTGNIGIEFLSRGAKKVYFSELDKKNIDKIYKNLEHTKFTNQSEVFFGDFRRNILKIRESVDYVYIDPPYDSNFYEESIKILLENNYFKNCLFIVEINLDIDFSKNFENLELIYEKKYGKKFIRFYREKV